MAKYLVASDQTTKIQVFFLKQRDREEKNKDTEIESKKEIQFIISTSVCIPAK